jgi:hypothetical protein
MLQCGSVLSVLSTFGPSVALTTSVALMTVAICVWVHGPSGRGWCASWGAECGEIILPTK